MEKLSSPRKRWSMVVVFALAMAWMESATVFYLRTLVGRVDPYQPSPLPPHHLLGNIELVREFATLILLFTAGWLAGREFRTRFSYMLIAFGTWDIFYYIFLAIIGPWPRSVMDWDVLFLIPLPWWGPVLAPCIIAALMILGGTLVTQFEAADGPRWPSHRTVALNWIGVVLALYVFMEHAIHILPQGEAVLRAALPTHFNWPLFLLAILLMSVPLVELSWRVWKRADALKPIRGS